ncbi:MAG: cation:proton antiporter subunit C [Opitutaceae bacterium]
MTDLFDLVLARLNYWIYVVLMMIGLFAMITKKNLIKKLIGMSIFQTAIILFYVSLGVKEGADLPIIQHHARHDATHQAVTPGEGAGSHEADVNAPDPIPEHEHDESAAAAVGGANAPAADPVADAITNPLPHVLMLTAIVVGVATLGVGLAVVQVIFLQFRSIEEDEILEQIRNSDG